MELSMMNGAVPSPPKGQSEHMVTAIIIGDHTKGRFIFFSGISASDYVLQIVYTGGNRKT
jgi:hypothetical protein